MTQEKIQQKNGISFLTFANLQGVRHGFSLRCGGVSNAPYNSLNMGFHVGDEPQAVQENRERFAAAVGFSTRNLVVGEQVHGTEIITVTADDCGRGQVCGEDALTATDGLICSVPEVVLMAHAADCSILFFYDSAQNRIGLAHAGWRGALARIGPLMVEAMAAQRSLSENIRVAISPTIGQCCYRVGENVTGLVPGKWHHKVLSTREGGLYLDLPELQRLLLLEAGVRGENIVRSRYCTSCYNDKFYSYRVSKGRTGRMAGVIMLNKREYK